MNQEDAALLAEGGWTVECESPFEISTKDGSFASQEAAHIVLHYLKGESQKCGTCAAFDGFACRRLRSLGIDRIPTAENDFCNHYERKNK